QVFQSPPYHVIQVFQSPPYHVIQAFQSPPYHVIQVFQSPPWTQVYTIKPEILLNDRGSNPSFPHEHADQSSFVRRISAEFVVAILSLSVTIHQT
ncbi:unnamed protein product, partial [Staurois parvus]